MSGEGTLEIVSPLERFFAIVQRELEADRVELHETGAAITLGPNDVSAPLPDGAQVVARLVNPPEDRDATMKRLVALVDTFGATVREAERVQREGPQRSARSMVQALHDELRALAERARASDAFVIDAHSPVVWGAATVSPVVTPGRGRTGDAPFDSTDGLPPASRTALESVRGLSAMAQLAKGRHLRHIVCNPDGGYAAHSFASIYLVVLVFDAVYDELRAERAVLEALPHIEGLVLALPPFDPEPSPHADVIAFRRRRR